jgi:hypothetical protein
MIIRNDVTVLGVIILWRISVYYYTCVMAYTLLKFSPLIYLLMRHKRVSP